MNRFRKDRSGITLFVLCIVAWVIDLGMLWGGNYL